MDFIFEYKMTTETMELDALEYSIIPPGLEWTTLLKHLEEKQLPLTLHVMENTINIYRDNSKEYLTSKIKEFPSSILNSKMVSLEKQKEFNNWRRNKPALALYIALTQK